MRESFEPADSDLEFISDQELRALLLRLQGEQEFEDKGVPDGHVTLDAVCEATGLTLGEVERALEEIRQQDQEAELARRIRELEEPLYRVERPGHAPLDPLASRPLSRKQLFSSLLDDQPKFGALPRRKAPPHHSPHEKFAGVVANIVLFAFALVTVILCGWAVISAIFR